MANPAWLSGGIQVLPNLVLPYNRLVIIAFALFVVVLTWLLLNKTRLGLNVRAVTRTATWPPAAACPPDGWTCSPSASAPASPASAAWP